MSQRNHIYQIAILYAADNDREQFPQNFDGEIFRQKYAEERLCVTLPENHPLSFQKEVSFRELDGLSILANGGSGFWQDIRRENLKSSAHVTYYLACLSTDREKYASVFNAACSALAREIPSASP